MCMIYCDNQFNNSNLIQISFSDYQSVSVYHSVSVLWFLIGQEQLTYTLSGFNYKQNSTFKIYWITNVFDLNYRPYTLANQCI
jgi:hypothetical protein